MEYEIRFIDQMQAELVSVDRPSNPSEGHVIGRTLYSLISPGTELYGGFLKKHASPVSTGYASVFQVEQVHETVESVKPGDIVFCMHQHQSFHHLPNSEFTKLPNGLDPLVAVIARLLNVSMTTLSTTKAKPGDKVLVTGAGPVGLLASHLFQYCGYDVTLVDPVKERLQTALASGIKQVLHTIPVEDNSLRGIFSLVLECSGNEEAVIEGSKIVQKGGEVVLIGVPWKRYTELLAHELCSLVFHNYVHLRSGWEWELPRYSSDFQSRSIQSNLELGLRWLNNGLFDVTPHIKKVSPKDAQQVYEKLVNKMFDEPFIVFDWSNLEVE